MVTNDLAHNMMSNEHSLSTIRYSGFSVTSASNPVVI